MKKAAEKSAAPAASFEPAAEERVDNGRPGVVGVGASAGGLEALTDLLGHMPGDTGLAFVLIQHLDPKHESHLAELLSKASQMPVTEVRDGTPAKANHVYVIPPRCNLRMADGVLHTLPRPESGRNMPIDSFLNSLAADHGTSAFGVILSGTGSDGTLGLQAIKEAGGITFAQEKRTAKFDGMPGSAIGAGVVDFILPPAEISGQLAARAGETRVLGESQNTAEQSGEAELKKIFHLLRTATGIDFTHYKHSTLQRRIKRRMALCGFETLEDYSQNLERNRAEAESLCESFFVTVTAFFREPAIFAELKKRVFPALVMNRSPEDPIRIWVPGCSTGEEAYSIAICLTEFLQESGINLPFQLFASDISEKVIEKARAGIYSDAALGHVSPQQLSRFFTKVDRGYQIAKVIRDVCVLARQNVVVDPPFSRLDLVSCCNVLIYLGALLQRKVLATLHHALKPNGFLVLGPSESIGTLSDSFHQLEKAHKIYRIRADATTPAPPFGDDFHSEGQVDPRKSITESRPGLQVEREADRLVLEQHGPPGVIVDDDLAIVQVRGHTAPYLELSPGEPTHHLLKMVREGLIVGLGKAIQAARQTNAMAKEDGFRVEGSGQLSEVAIRVIPFAGSSKERYFLVLFEDKEGNAKAQKLEEPVARGELENARLRRELTATKEYLRSIVDDKANTLEELRAANEEAQASNEELETAKEELESANEELKTLNEDLKISNVELGQVNRDVTNLLESISIPLVMVGRDLRIRRFTRAMEPLMNLIASDVGRSITDLQPQMELPDLRRLLLDAMEWGDRKPLDIRDSQGRWYSLRILPSVGPDGKIDGAVLMLMDVDAAKRGLDFAEAIVETVREPLVILSQNLQVMKANRAFYETFPSTREETEGRLIYDLGNGQWNIPELRDLLENILPTHSTFRDFEVTREFQRVGPKVMLLNASEIFNPNAQVRTILLAIEDVTDRKQAEEALKTTNAELQHFAYAVTHDLQEPLRMVVNFTQLLGRDYKGRLDEDADKIISYSVEGALRIEALLKALLAYWEVTGREQKTLARVDCEAVLAKALSHLAAATAESGAIVTYDPLPTLIAEEAMLLQVFQNLISNSIKYRGEEPPRIHVSAKQDGERWLFAVRDNGIGIDSEDKERVFGMFKRLHGTNIPGTGIGLALCKKVVERQGGRIWVESESGQGATFRFTIPVGRNETGRRREERT